MMGWLNPFQHLIKYELLFADLPGFSKLAANLNSVECVCYASRFFAWFEGGAGRSYGGIVDKFIWEVSGPSEFKPKNMDALQVVQIQRKPMWIPNFDILEDIREIVAHARQSGTVVDDSGAE
jgi:hypothetical protein